MSSADRVAGEEVGTESHRRVRRFIAAMMREGELSEEAQKTLGRLAASDQDLAQVGVDELIVILLEALR